MRIRKNGLGVSPIVFPEDSHFNPGQEVQTRYCQLNQSRWDVMTDFSPPDSPMAPPHSNPFEVEEEYALAVFNDPIPKPPVDPEKQTTTDECHNNDFSIEEDQEEHAPFAVNKDPIPKPIFEDPKEQTTTDEFHNNDLTIEEDQEEHALAVTKDLIPKPFVDPEEQTTDEYYNYDVTIEEVDQKLPKLPPTKENLLITGNVQPRHELTAGGGYQIPKPPPTADAKKNDTAVIFKSTQWAIRDLLRGWIKDREDEAAAAASSSSPSSDLLGRFRGFGPRSGRKRKAYGKPNP